MTQSGARQGLLSPGSRRYTPLRAVGRRGRLPLQDLHYSASACHSGLRSGIQKTPSRQPNPNTPTTQPQRPATLRTFDEAWYLCEFYFANTLPLLQLLDEQDKLAGERKIISLLVNNFQGRAKHSDLMILAHMRKREFKEIIESLIEKEAITVETYVSSQGNTGRMYVLAADLFNSWHS